MSYFDIEKILSEEERVPVTFKVDTDTYRKGSNQELPFWLARVLEQEDYLAYELPKVYGEKFTTHLKSDPAAISLRRNPYYYELGLLLSNLNEEASDIPTTLLTAFRARFLRIVDEAVNWRSEDNSYAEKLSVFEEKLFHSTRSAAVQLERWKNRKEEKIVPAMGLPQTGVKRKRLNGNT